MKKLGVAISLALYALASAAATLSPVQLLNPAGSTSGQAIVSTGPSTAPAWGNVPVANVTGAAALTGATFTGDLTVSEPSAALIMNDTSGSGFPQFVYRSAGVNKWIVFDQPGTHVFTVNRYVGGVFQDQPLVISNSSGAVTMADGITASPISGSTGSFTTLAASSTVSGTGFSTYLASPPAIGTTTPAAGKFTTLQATGAITPAYPAGIVGNVSGSAIAAGSVGEYNSVSASGVSLTSNSGTNITSQSLGAGDWDVSCSIQYVPAGSTTVSGMFAGISTTSANLGGVGFQNQTITGLQTGSPQILSTPVVRIHNTTTTTVFCVGALVFGTSTATANAFMRWQRAD